MEPKKRGNPAPKGNQYAKGRTVAPEVFEGRKLTKLVWEQAIHKYMHMDRTALKDTLANPGNIPAFELMVVSVMAKALSNGDTYRIEFLLNRILGKVPDKVEYEDKTDEAKIEELKREYMKVALKPK